jgi:uncharacterized protein YcaQ
VAEVTPAQARRIAIRAQLLDGSATSVLDTVRRLGSLQLDPTARVAPTQFLVLWSRLGTYDTAELARLLEERELFEWIAFVYPKEALPALLSAMQRWPEGRGAWRQRVREWLRANSSFKRYVLRELERNGPMLSRQFEDRARVPWPKAERKYGYFVLPVLHRDRLVGPIDPELDRERGVLRINAVHWEGKPVPIERPARSLARFLGVREVEWPKA